MYINKTLSSVMAEHVFFLSTSRTFIKFNHTLGHKASFNKFQMFEIIRVLSVTVNAIIPIINNIYLDIQKYVSK